MNANQRKVLRLAIAIRERLAAAPKHGASVELPEYRWNPCVALADRIQRAQQHGWTLAAQRLQGELAIQLRQLSAELEGIACDLQPEPICPVLATAADLYYDSLELQEAFDDVQWDLNARTLSVITAPVTLEGIYLGPFKVQLDWSDLRADSYDQYRVIAVDPHPAASRDNVTHPHVEGERVCEGEARAPIRRALEQGRIGDFFKITANLLNTYNAESPFVSLDNWHGVECSDCGAVASDEDRCLCERCECDLCGDCSVYCPGCDRCCCASCVTVCPKCDQYFCGACLAECSACQVSFCIDCLMEGETCEKCNDNVEIDEEPPEDDGQPASAHPPVQSDRVGQTAVPA